MAISFMTDDKGSFTGLVTYGRIESEPDRQREREGGGEEGVTVSWISQGTPRRGSLHRVGDNHKKYKECSAPTLHCIDRMSFVMDSHNCLVTAQGSHYGVLCSD